MTQLVGALCEKRKTIITVSDRMVSSGDMSITFEPDKPKHEVITNKCLMLTAGTLLEPGLIEDIKEKGRNESNIRKLVELCKAEFRALKRKRIEEEILHPAGFESMSDYHEKSQRLHDALVMQLNDRIQRHDLEFIILLVGIDDKGGHLYLVTDPGTEACYDSVGFCCPGAGQSHTDPVFALYRYTPSVSAKEALFVAYQAKKRAEMAGGIGIITDATIITQKEGMREILPETLQQLEAVHEEQEKGGWREWLNSRVEGLRIETRALETP